MTAIVQNFEMHSGDTVHLDVTLTDDDEVAVNVTGATITYVLADWQVRLTKTTGAGITINSNVVTIALDPEDTASLSGKYDHELQVVDGDSDVTTVMVGAVTIKKDWAA